MVITGVAGVSGMGSVGRGGSSGMGGNSGMVGVGVAGGSGKVGSCAGAVGGSGEIGSSARVFPDGARGLGGVVGEALGGVSLILALGKGPMGSLSSPVSPSGTEDGAATGSEKTGSILVVLVISSIAFCKSSFEV